MDNSKVQSRDAAFSRYWLPVRRVSGATVMREVYTGHMRLPEHEHDGVTLTIPLVGGFQALSDVGESSIVGASAVLHPAGRAHAVSIFDDGVEVIGLYLDPDWLRWAGLGAKVDRTFYWTGGKAGALARRLARAWIADDWSEAMLAGYTVRCLRQAAVQEAPSKPRWMEHIDAAMAVPAPLRVGDIARKLDLHPAWLNHAYRAAMGEGLNEALRRRRVELAIRSLRRSDAPLADIALQAGFCDQSHMNRTFRAFLGRTPLDVRRNVLPPLEPHGRIGAAGGLMPQRWMEPRAKLGG